MSYDRESRKTIRILLAHHGHDIGQLRDLRDRYYCLFADIVEKAAREIRKWLAVHFAWRPQADVMFRILNVIDEE